MKPVWMCGLLLASTVVLAQGALAQTYDSCEVEGIFVQRGIEEVELNCTQGKWGWVEEKAPFTATPRFLVIGCSSDEIRRLDVVENEIREVHEQYLSLGPGSCMQTEQQYTRMTVSTGENSMFFYMGLIGGLSLRSVTISDGRLLGAGVARDESVPVLDRSNVDAVPQADPQGFISFRCELDFGRLSSRISSLLEKIEFLEKSNYNAEAAKAECESRNR